MRITDIYKKYNIMPMLQLHQLRVAAVAKLICDNETIDLDCDKVVKACLLHDIGNIVKFDLTYIPEAVEPKGLNYWQNVKNKFIQKYGKDEHSVTYKILREITKDSRIHDLVESIGFPRSCKNLKLNDYSKKISCYADHRVTPFGITSLEKRMQDGRNRFKRNKGGSCKNNQLKKYSTCMRKLEKQIFKKCNIVPEDINDTNVNPVIRKLELKNTNI